MCASENFLLVLRKCIMYIYIYKHLEEGCVQVRIL